MKKQYTTAATALAIGIATAIPVFAADNNNNNDHRGGVLGMFRSHMEDNDGKDNDKNDNTSEMGDMRNRRIRPVVIGTVTSISGTTITVSGETGMHTASTTQATTIFTIDATNAKVMKDNATSTISVIAIGDKLVVSGTLTGTNVVATMMYDGNKIMGVKHGRDHKDDKDHTKKPMFVGNGQPIMLGTITTITGNTITISNKSNVTYTINASTSTVLVKNATSTLSALAAGDQLLVQGTVNGTSIVASTIIDSGKVETTTGSTGDTEGYHQGMMQGFRGFLSRIFGF